MKKVFIKAYTQKNLGDDLFLKIITDRYKNDFSTVTSAKYGKINNNLKMKRAYDLIIRTDRKVASILNSSSLIEKYFFRKSDLVLVLGGSIFMEEYPKSAEELSRFYLNCNKDIYILGSNFGPYKTKRFLKTCKEQVFPKAKDIYFRDKKTFNLFKDLNNVRYAPDIVFTLDLEKYKSLHEKRVVISVINCKKRIRQIGFDASKEYEDKIIELIKFFYEKGYKITLMSFCKAEGDELTINKLKDRLNNLIKIDTYFYDKNIEEAIEILASSEIIIGSRFHANVLGLLLEKTIIPIEYNLKTTNLLDDIGYSGIRISLKDIRLFNPTDIDEKQLSYKCDVSKQIIEAQNNFINLDKELEKKR